MSGRIEDLPDADLALRLADEATEKWPELAEYLRSVGDFIQRSKGCALVPDVRPGDHIEVVRRIRYGPNRSKLRTALGICTECGASPADPLHEVCRRCAGGASAPGEWEQEADPAASAERPPFGPMPDDPQDRCTADEPCDDCAAEFGVPDTDGGAS